MAESLANDQRANEPAFPYHDVHSVWDMHKQQYTRVETTVIGGLTKRELFAAMAMQGLLAGNPPRPPGNEESATALITNASVRVADALLAALKEVQP